MIASPAQIPELAARAIAASRFGEMPWRRGDLEHLQESLAMAVTRLGDAQSEASRTYDLLKRLHCLASTDAAHCDAITNVIDLWLSDLTVRLQVVQRELTALSDPAVLRLPGQDRT